ncbi:MAG: tail fiber domain-containing protein, partial [Bryobacteraceae bacterium]
MSFMRLLSHRLFLPFCLLSLDISSSQAQSVANFVSMPPCRVIETRDPNFGAFGPPGLAANSSRDFAIPASPCGVPSGALAYSFNITVIPHGSLPYLTMWPTGQNQPGVSTLNSFSGSVVANAAIVPAGTNGSVSVYVAGNTELIVDINGYFVAYVPPAIPATPPMPTIPVTIAQASNDIQSSTSLGTGASSAANHNTAVGFNSLHANYNGNSNTALGANALGANVSGSNNVGIGSFALSNNVGSSNTAVGTQALLNNGIANNNTAVGFQALWSHNGGGCCNTAIGFGAMSDDTGSQNNVAIGNGALSGNLTGGNNIAIGVDAGSAVTGDSNVHIGNVGQASDSNVIRIGTSCSTPCAPGQQRFAYVAGIFGTGVNSGSAVYVGADGKLGTFPSSQRYKEDVQDMGAASDALMQLRPVQFRYKQAAPDGTKPLQFGLIAEEVAGVNPELVLRDIKGQIETKQYQQLPSKQLNQMQNHHQTIELQAREI